MNSTHYCLGYNYEPSAECPKWMAFLQEVLPERGAQRVLQEFLGCIFMDRSKYKLECMMLLYGTGANGKSVVYEIIQDIVGYENMSSYDVSDLTRSNTKDYNLSEIDGKLVNYCSDMDYKDSSGGGFKKLISGEAVMAREIQKSPREIRDFPIMMDNVNMLPDTSDKSDGHFRRYVIVPFEVTIPKEKQDKKLRLKLREELPGILNWILEGRSRYISNNCKFSDSTLIDSIQLKYRKDQDSIFAFIQHNRLEAESEKYTKKQRLPLKDIFMAYESFCVEEGYKPHKRKSFKDYFGSRKFEIKKSNGEKLIFYCGRKVDDLMNKDWSQEQLYYSEYWMTITGDKTLEIESEEIPKEFAVEEESAPKQIEGVNIPPDFD